MANAFTIPSIFTAIDRISAPMQKMGANVQAFAAKAESAVARADRAFRKLTPAIGGAAKQFLAFASAAAISAALLAGGAFSVKSIMDYETELANLQAVTGASGAVFDTFKGKIQEVANATGKSSVEVAKAFTAIANNQPALLKDANALAMVTQSSILLAQASKMELQPAGEALTQILNQFGKGATEAARTVDILAAGSVAGSSEIRDTAAAIQQFGTVAANAGVKINESVALIELASKFEKGAEAGVKLRNILITMSAIKVQDPKALKDLHRLGVNMNIVSNSALPLNQRLLEISKISKDNAALFHVFGKENQAMAAGVLSTSANFAGMVDSVNTAGMASSMAAKNNDTLAITIEQLKAKWVNMITGANGTTDALKSAKDAVRFLSRNMETIISVGTKLLIGWVAIKAILITSKVALVAYNIVLGISNALMGKHLLFSRASAIAMKAQVITTNIMTAAQWALNFAMEMNPIGLMIIAVAALSALVVAAVVYWDSWGKTLADNSGIFGTLITQVHDFTESWGAVQKGFENGGILGALEAIGRSILNNLLAPVEKLLELMAAATAWTGNEYFTNKLNDFKQFRSDYVNGTDSNNPVAGGLTTTPAINPKAAEQDAIVSRMLSVQQQNVKIDINDKSNGKAKVSSDSNMVPINLTSTMSWGSM